MDKRFFLALVLTGAVVLLTPVIFPRPKGPAPVVAVDSTRAAAARPAAAAVSRGPSRG